jgi:hypothetical protein
LFFGQSSRKVDDLVACFGVAWNDECEANQTADALALP